MDSAAWYFSVYYAKINNNVLVYLPKDSIRMLDSLVLILEPDALDYTITLRECLRLCLL
jgi:hypothetical protein